MEITDLNIHRKVFSFMQEMHLPSTQPLPCIYTHTLTLTWGVCVCGLCTPPHIVDPINNIVLWSQKLEKGERLPTMPLFHWLILLPPFIVLSVFFLRSYFHFCFPFYSYFPSPASQHFVFLFIYFLF